MIGFDARFGVDLFDLCVGEDLFGLKRLLEERDRVFGILVILNLAPGAVGLVRVGDGVAAVTIGIDFHDAGLGFFAGEREEFIHRGPYVVEIVAVAGGPGHSVGAGTFREAKTGGRTLLARTHGI